jgi:hypothetical protein
MIRRAAIGLLVTMSALSCADRPVTPTAPGPGAAPPPSAVTLSLSAHCLGPFRPADYAALACAVVAQDPTNAGRNDFQAFADLRQFGGPAESAIPACTACGSPGKTFDLDLRIPQDMTPGRKTFVVWATDPRGQRAEASAVLEIVAR